jgi:hypothetical protein
MKESFVDGVGAIVANDQAAKVAEPGEGALSGKGLARYRSGSVPFPAPPP